LERAFGLHSPRKQKGCLSGYDGYCSRIEASSSCARYERLRRGEAYSCT
jgi:hypothetical protein